MVYYEEQGKGLKEGSCSIVYGKRGEERAGRKARIKLQQESDLSALSALLLPRAGILRLPAPDPNIAEQSKASPSSEPAL